jgi:hypothetical protein
MVRGKSQNISAHTKLLKGVSKKIVDIALKLGQTLGN